MGLEIQSARDDLQNACPPKLHQHRVNMISTSDLGGLRILKA